MAKISSYSTATAAAAADLIPIVQGGTTKNVARENLGVKLSELDPSAGGTGAWSAEELTLSDFAQIGNFKFQHDSISSLADDASSAFTLGPDSVGSSLFLLFSRAASVGVQGQGLFFSGNSAQVDIGSGSLLAYGGTSNPDTDDKINVWVSGGYINIKNRSGYTANFYLLKLAYSA